MPRIRIATLQYFVRPVEHFEEFSRQVEGLVDTAADYRSELIVFPEYFSIQLLTLGDVRRPIEVQVRDLARHRDRFVELMSGLAKKHGVAIVAGSIPIYAEEGESETGDRLVNACHVFGPSGAFRIQTKLHATRWEREEWLISAGSGLKVFEADFGLFAVNICYDVEFPELARAAARRGAVLLVVPSCTDDRQGFLRVRYCAQARAIENQMFVVHSSTVGSLPMVPPVALNYGQSAILTPSDFPFARDGILAEGNANQEMMVIGEVDLELAREARENGSVLPLKDSQTTAEVMKDLEVERI